MVRVWQLKPLHGRNTFKAIRLNGSVFNGDLLRCTYLVEPSDVPCLRFAVIVGKRFGSAVRRNQLKRWIREAVRTAVRERGARSVARVSLLLMYYAKKPSREVHFADLKKDVMGFLGAIRISILAK